MSHRTPNATPQLPTNTGGGLWTRAKSQAIASDAATVATVGPNLILLSRGSYPRQLASRPGRSSGLLSHQWETMLGRHPALEAPTALLPGLGLRTATGPVMDPATISTRVAVRQCDSVRLAAHPT